MPGGRQLRDRVTPHLPWLLILFVVVAANGPSLFGPFDIDPALSFSGLGVNLRAGMLPGASTIDPNAGFQAQALGYRAAEDWASGHLPWWNPFEGVGMPLAGNMQSGSMLPTVVLMLLADGLLYSHMILEAASGLATYALLRRMGVRPWIASAAGSAFALNGTFAWLAIAPVNVIAFLPLTILGVERAIECSTAGRRGGWSILALGIALSVYGGFPETAFIDGLLIAVWWVARVARLPSAAVRAVLAKSAAGVTCGAALSAPLLLAFVDDLQRADVGPHGGALARAALPAAGSVQMGFPYFLGPIFGFVGTDRSGGELTQVWGGVGGYVGTSLMFLALLSLGGRTHRLLRLALAGWVVIVVARIYGVSAATTLVNVVPGAASTAFYRYAPVSVEFALVVLAAFAIEDVAGDRPAAHRLLRSSLALVASVVACVVVVHEGRQLGRLLSGGLHVRSWQDASLMWGAAILIALALGAVAPRGRTAILGGLLVVDALALFVVPEFSANRGGAVDTAPVAYLRAHLGQRRAFALAGALMPNYGSYYGVAEIDDNDLPIPDPWAGYIETRLDPNSGAILFTGGHPINPAGPSAAEEVSAHLQAFGAAGVAYVVAPSALSAMPGLHQAWADDHFRVFAVPNPAPYFSVSGPGCSVRSTSRTSADVECATPNKLVRLELDEPGWTASAGGRQLRIMRYHNLFQSVAVPAGRTHVDFAFDPPLMVPAEVAAVLAAVWLLWPLYGARVRRLVPHGRPESA